MGNIGEPVRRYTLVPLDEPIAPTNEPALPQPPEQAPEAPVTPAEPEKVE